MSLDGEGETLLREMTEEYLDDRSAYFEDCLKIKPKSGPLVPLVLNRAQREVDRRADEQLASIGYVRMLVPKARQLGISTLINARGFHKASLSADPTNAFVLTHRDDATLNLFQMVRRYQDNAPNEFRHKAKQSSAKGLLLDNGSQYLIGTAGGATGSVGRSFTFQFFHGSETAFWSNQNEIATGALQALALEPGTEGWLESTGNGRHGLFFEYCQDAIAGRGIWQLAFLPWTWDAGYSMSPMGGWGDPGPAWIAYAEAHGLTEDQLCWAWNKNLELIKGTDLEVSVPGTPDEPCAMFRQEYPASLDDAFQANAEGKLISAEAVAKARKAFLEVQTWAPVLLGVDCGAGNDWSTMIDRQGRHVGKRVKEKHKTPTAESRSRFCDRLIEVMKQHRAKRVFVDTTGGYGLPIYDRLVELGYGDRVEAVNYASQARNPLYANKRVEMWLESKAWVESPDGASIPDDNEIEAHALSTRSLPPDHSGRHRLEAKDLVRKREGFSPDWWDAVAQTFASPVMSDEAELSRRLSSKPRKPRSW